MSQHKFSQQIGQVFEAIERATATYTPDFDPEETGKVVSIAAGIAKVTGLPNTGLEELLRFPGDLYGIAFNLDESEIGVVMLGESGTLKAGDVVARTGRVMDIPVGENLLGRVVDPLGEPRDGKGPVMADTRFSIERAAPPIMSREQVREPLQTGIKVIDAIIPIGLGQRELILGDRQTGKTAIAIDTILNQHDKNVLCVYCAIGQQAASLAKVIAALQEKGAMDYTVVVATEGNNPPGLQYIAPYAATSIAEYFMEHGRNVLIVYDDLTHHARAYRELSLLLRRPPGREAFPGDIFYIHSRLLERSTRMNDAHGGGSLTALPIIETEAQNISAYIPTNLISITDGQLYLSPKLFDMGVLPAVEIGRSVSRVGGKAQLPAYRKLAGNLKLDYAQFEELESFARFGMHLDAPTKKIIVHGERIRACLKQAEMSPMPAIEQLFVLLALTNGLLDEVPLERIGEAEKLLRESVGQLPDQLSSRLTGRDKLSTEDEQALVDRISRVLKAFSIAPAPQKTS